MSDTLDYYQLLHVHPDAPAEIIKASYRALMQALKQHPDLGGDHDRAALINQAYAVLMDAGQRRAYDASRLQKTAGPRDDVAARQRPAPHPGPKRSAARLSQRRWRCEFCAQPHSHCFESGGEQDADALCARCASPLRPSLQVPSDGAGQRALARYPRRAPLQLWARWGEPHSAGLSLDVSLRGMQIETATELIAGQRIRIACELCDAVGKVVHLRANEDHWQVGVEFVTLRFGQSRGSFVSTEA